MMTPCSSGNSATLRGGFFLFTSGVLKPFLKRGAWVYFRISYFGDFRIGGGIIGEVKLFERNIMYIYVCAHGSDRGSGG